MLQRPAGKAALLCCLVLCGALVAHAAARPFTAVPADATPPLPPIVLPFDAAAGTGFDWAKLSKLNYYSATTDRGGPLFGTVRYLREGIKAMTGREVPVVSGTDFSRGIVLTLLSDAPAEIKNDPGVVAALANDGKDAYNANEAYLVRSEPNRVVVVANTQAGLSHGVVELLESVGYEVLGMGPDWVHAPDFHGKPLTFNLERSGRPGYYLRSLVATSGQSYGVGTLFLKPLPDASDETVELSYNRWLIGTRMAGQSMPGFPGHALQGFHRRVVAAMREQKIAEGFLVPKTTIGAAAQRPAAAPENAGQMWINDTPDAPSAPGRQPEDRAFISNGKEWVTQNLISVDASLDLSVPLVRQVILDEFKTHADQFFAKTPNDVFVFGTDAEDGGGHGNLGQLMRYKQWYPEYLKQEGVAFPQKYVLNGFKGLDQPLESWDAESGSDFMFGFNNWLLREYDKWLATRPATERVTAASKSKRDLVRASFYSYNYHDVPPNFNLDPRIRVMIAGYPKHRGWGKWKNFKSQTDMARAFQVMLPREPSGDYWIISLSYYWDMGLNGMAGTHGVATVHNSVHDDYEAGFRALSVETDYNFGKMGLPYYLYAKMLWNPNMTMEQLEAQRIHWLQSAFGSAWPEMKAYYDFMDPASFTINAPHSWARAVGLLDAADKKLAGANEPAAQQRLDDLKQFWYFYYLLDSGQAKPTDRALREFVWKGQMSYMTAMHAVTRGIFKTNSAADAAGDEFNKGPAHYSHAETQAWWAKVVAQWPLIPVSEFAAAKLANGKSGREVDQNDLVAVREFVTPSGLQLPPDTPLVYNSGYQKQPSFYTVARLPREEVGFKLIWPYGPNDNYYRDRDTPYGISFWNTAAQRWDLLVDKNVTVQHSALVTAPDGKPYQMVEVRYPAPLAGTYRFDLGNGGNLARLTTLDFDLRTGTNAGPRAQTYALPLEGLTQSGVWVYLPKGTKSFDVEVWDTYGAKKVQLHNGLPAKGMKATRTVDIGKRGTHTVALNPGEDGSLALITGNGFGFPLVYSVPMLWAKTPSQLLVPRAVLEADGLTPNL